MDRLPHLPKRRPDAHKGDCGRILIVAGSRGMAGAAALASEAAYRAGAGLVTLAVPDAILDTVAGLQVCATLRPFPLEGEVQADVVAVGPGMGSAAALEIRKLVDATTLPLVLDADGLNAYADQPDLLVARGRTRILTPHPGELARLTGSTPAAINRNRRKAAEAAARRFKSIVVLKGRGTVVTDGRRTRINETGNAGMATGGTGDVLTGVIASLIGQGMEPFEAARLGVHLHGRAGDLAAREMGERSLLATDVIDYLPAAILEHEEASR